MINTFSSFFELWLFAACFGKGEHRRSTGIKAVSYNPNWVRQRSHEGMVAESSTIETDTRLRATLSACVVPSGCASLDMHGILASV
jgi:hypothetical protein